MTRLLLFCSTLLLLSSCKNLVPYSDALKTKYHLQSSDLMRVQFYVSSPITLQRKVTDVGNAQVVNGKVKLVNGQSMEEVVIPKGTPGVLVADGEGKLSVSFEKTDAHFLKFGPNPDLRQQYVLLASNWKNKIGLVHYAGQEYFTSPESSEAILLIDLKHIRKYSKSERVASGRKVN